VSKKNLKNSLQSLNRIRKLKTTLRQASLKSLLEK